jgi:hypothetical protein
VLTCWVPYLSARSLSCCLPIGKVRDVFLCAYSKLRSHASRPQHLCIALQRCLLDVWGGLWVGALDDEAHITRRKLLSVT